MKFKVYMAAFMGAGVVRVVDVPDGELQQATSRAEVMDLVFRHGQNDFQPVKDRCSVSTGDVIWIPFLCPPHVSAEAWAPGYWMVAMSGFEQITDEAFGDLHAADQEARAKLITRVLMGEVPKPKQVGVAVKSVEEEIADGVIGED